MNVALLNFQASMNYGALLQCYALKQAIYGLGHKCTVINYVPSMHDYKGNPISFLTKRQGFVRKAAFALPYMRELKKKTALVSRFRETYLCPAPGKPLHKADLPAYTSGFDTICCGSDQIWNLNQGDAEDKAFMLDFEHENRSIAYAVSFGDGLKTKRSKIESALPLIRRFDAISVREQEGWEFLRDCGVESTIALDPTLLVEADTWKPFLGENPIGKPYILVYGFENAHQKFSDLVEVAHRVSKDLGLPVINPVLNPGLAKEGFEARYATGPIEFLRLVQHASFVCTSSYHCCIFSMVLGVPFVAVFADGTMQEPRKKTLLRMAGAENRAVSPSGCWSAQELLSIDASNMHDRMLSERKKSMKFLSDAIGGGAS